MNSQKTDVANVLVIMIAALLVLRPFWSYGMPNANDFLMSVHRVFELKTGWELGIFFPRFGADLTFGYGAPLFQFYPPLASYLALIFHWFGLGYVDALKAVLTFSMLSGSIGVYFYARFLLRDRWVALTSSLLYLLTPYLLTIVYERGAVAESMTWALLPWFFLFAHRCYKYPRRKDAAILAAVVALMILGHNATAMFVVPGVALFIFLLALFDRNWRPLFIVAGTFLLGAGISAFDWMPALGELHYTNTSDIMLNAGTDVRNNVVSLTNLIQTTLAHQFVGPQRFRYSLWPFVLGLCVFIPLVIRRGKVPAITWLFGAAWGLILILQTDFALNFWTDVPFVDFIQFPWRLYGFASFSIVMLAGTAFMVTKPSSRTGLWVWAVTMGAVVAIAWYAGTTNASPGKLSLWAQMDEGQISKQQMWERGVSDYPLFDDYSLTTQQLRTAHLALSRPAEEGSILPPTNTPSINVISEHPMRYVLNVHAPQPWTLRLHRLYFPGWQIYQDGAPVETRADGVAGLVTAELPAGDYRVEAKFGDSLLRTIATLLSVLSLAIWITLLVRSGTGWIDLLIIAILAIGIGVSVRLLSDFGKQPYQPTAFETRFEGDVTLYGYHLPPAALCAGDQVPLRLYWFVSKTPEVDLKYFIHINNPEEDRIVAQFDSIPFDGFSPMTRWESGELVPDEKMLAIPADIAPGVYQVLVGLYDPVTVQNQIVLDAPDVLPGERLPLTELEIVACPE